MARTIITTQTLFFLLIISVLAIFFYNVVHFSTRLKDNAYQEKIAEKNAEIVRLKAQIAANTCDSDSDYSSEGDQTSQITPTLPPAPPIIHYSNSNSSNIPVIPILLMACNREDYLQTTLQHLFKYKPPGFPIFVSQGCGHPGVETLLREKYSKTVVALKHYKNPNAQSYFAIAQHYGWALAQIFSNMNYEAVIILEDDMEISSDFFEYFISLYPILKNDPTLYCISSWNDNGFSDAVKDPKAIRRTDIFPGLGWMMEKSLWEEFENTWPSEYWDEFMRLPSVRKQRSCLYPEISRNKNIGVMGASQGQFWDKIGRIKFNDEHVNFTKLDLSYLYKDKYDKILLKDVKKARVVTAIEVSEYENEDLRINYRGQSEFANTARFFQIMDDEKEGMPRTSYRGVVTFYSHGNRIFVTPEDFPN